MLKMKMSIYNSETDLASTCEQERETYYDMGISDLYILGEFVHTALKNAGYNFHKDIVLLQDLTVEEAGMLEDYLEDIRANRKGEEKE